MTPIANKIGNALLEHHKEHCSGIDTLPEPATGENVRGFTITYGNLLRKAAVEDHLLPRSVGPYLDELAAWSIENEFPPINALAVRAEDGIPGFGFNDAEGCSNWSVQVRKCISFKYPATIAPMLAQTSL
jgi:hypothetical protein